MFNQSLGSGVYNKVESKWILQNPSFCLYKSITHSDKDLFQLLFFQLFTYLQK